MAGNLTFEFPFGRRTYKGRLLRATKPGETDALVFGLGTGAKPDRRWVIFHGEDGWWHPAHPNGLTPIARAAIRGLEAAQPSGV